MHSYHWRTAHQRPNLKKKLSETAWPVNQRLEGHGGAHASSRGASRRLDPVTSFRRTRTTVLSSSLLCITSRFSIPHSTSGDRRGRHGSPRPPDALCEPSLCASPSLVSPSPLLFLAYPATFPLSVGGEEGGEVGATSTGEMRVWAWERWRRIEAMAPRRCGGTRLWGGGTGGGGGQAARGRQVGRQRGGKRWRQGVARRWEGFVDLVVGSGGRGSGEEVLAE